MKTLYPQLKTNIQDQLLIAPGDVVILAFSGGKDSVTLFHLLKRLQEDISFQLKAAYFNHKLRSDADEEEQWVRDFCDSQGVELVVGGKNVREFKSASGLNLEHAASLSRYGFFKEVSSKYRQAKVATAHTKSDLTETFFIKLFRGSGLQGLSAVFSKKENTIIRPLLLFPQADIYAFLKRNAFAYYTDYTNRQDDFLRNRIRNRLIPEIEKIEPKVNDHVFRTVSIIQDEYDYFSRLALDKLEGGLVAGKILPVSLFEDCHIAVQRHIVREYLRLLKGNLLNIDFRHIEALRIRNRELGGMAVPDVELKFHKGYIYPRSFSIPSYEYIVQGPGETLVPEAGRKVVVKKVRVYEKPKNNIGILVPCDAVTFPLTIRAACKDDRYTKINTAINQKVFEMIRASGMPMEMRNLCPLVVNGDGRLIWCAGSPLADGFKVKEKQGKEFLSISVRNV